MGTLSSRTRPSENRPQFISTHKEDTLQKLKLGIRDSVIESVQQSATPPQQPTAPAKPSKADVEQKIDKFVKQGFLVQHRDEYRIQLTKPKKFSWFFAFLWLLCFGVGIVVYLIYYWVKRDKVVTLNL